MFRDQSKDHLVDVLEAYKKGRTNLMISEFFWLKTDFLLQNILASFDIETRADIKGMG